MVNSNGGEFLLKQELSPLSPLCSLDPLLPTQEVLSRLALQSYISQKYKKEISILHK